MAPDSSTTISFLFSFSHNMNHTSTSSQNLLTQEEINDFLETKNQEFVSSMAPTLTYIALLMACGIAGNAVVLVVYYGRFKPSVTRTYILAMSVVDLLTNVLSLPVDITEILLHNTFSEPWLCKGLRTVKSFLGFLSALILVAVAFDRQRAICSPQSNPTTVKHVGVVLVVVSASALAFTIPYTVLTGPMTVPYKDSNITGLECSTDDVFVKSLFLFIYNMITGVLFIVCIALMLGSYVRIARQIWLHKKNTAFIVNSSSSAGEDSKRKPSDPHSQSYTFVEDSSSSTRTQKSSATGSQQSQKKDLPQDGIELTQQGVQHQKDLSSTSNDQVAPTAGLRHVEEPKDLPSPLEGLENHPSHEVKQSAKKSLSRSRAVLSRIGRTARDARAFISWKKYPSSNRRGSVKKIPTRTTCMMFVLTVIFVVNYLPYLVLVSVRSRRGVAPLVQALGLNGYHVGLRSYFINSAVNPLVYSFCSARFRQECRRLFCKKRT